MGQRFIVLNQFEGPLDLLLHLVREQQMDIFSVDLYHLTLQYLDFLRRSDFADLSDAGSFVQMASYLVEMKSASLLPRKLEDRGDRGESSEDPDEDEQARLFRERLHQYNLFRGASQFLSHAGTYSGGGYSSYEWHRLEGLYGSEVRAWTGDPATLLILYEQMLTSLVDRKTDRVVARSHKLAIDALMERLISLVNKVPAFKLDDCYEAMPSRHVLMAGIVAFLQLAKDSRVSLRQEEGPYSQLWITRCSDGAAGGGGRRPEENMTDGEESESEKVASCAQLDGESVKEHGLGSEKEYFFDEEWDLLRCFEETFALSP